MNTLFKFFVQVWLLWGIAAAIGFRRVWAATRLRDNLPSVVIPRGTPGTRGLGHRFWSLGWRGAAVGLLLASLAYPLFGTQARLVQRMSGWRPPMGTLDGMAFMERGSYTWPNDDHRIELRYDHAAIQWLLENVRGNLVIAESAEVDYYRAGGTRIASFTGLSGLMGKHENEQRAGSQVAQRHSLMREFWETSDLERTLQLARELNIALVYAGQLERHQHAAGVEKMQHLAELGVLEILYETAGSVVYAFPERIVQHPAGYWIPAQRATVG